MAATSGVIITDHTGADEPIIWVNTAFEEITGYSAGEAVGRNCRFLNEGVDGTAEVKEELRTAIANNDSISVVMPNKRASGEIFWNRLNLSPISGTRDEISHYVGVVNDVSVQVESARELETALAEEEAARAAAEKSSNARDSFVSFVSHELRAPLNAAQTWLDLMEMDPSPEILEKGLLVVRNSVETQTRLIADLGDVARATAGRIVIDPEPFNITEALATVVDQMRPEMEKKAMDFTADLPEEPITIDADEVRILQVVRNLLVNARRYTGKGGRINISMTHLTKEIEIVVADSGKGLETHELSKIFQPYWRADSKVKGLGIGLALARAIIDAHGGRIFATSDGVDQGARFHVRLPKHSLTAQSAAAIHVGESPDDHKR
ncbi:MAG: PAS domain-containing protein [Gammaproteobacteria bacterium]|nr:PAS domain-containing protein [Gammaproteobacteria bacterium]